MTVATMETVTEFLGRLAAIGVKVSADAGQLNCYAQRGTITSDVKADIVRYKPEILALLERNTARTPVISVKEFPLSAGQKGLYILDKLNPGMSAYNVPLCFRINTAIDATVMAAAWQAMLDQFPILTARVVEKEGSLYHRLDESCRTTLRQSRIDVTGDDALLSFLKIEAKKPFDLNHGPLARIELFTQGEQRSVLLLTIHHIIFDGVSAVVVLRSLLTFYEQLAAGLPLAPSPELLGYQEFVAWEEAMLASPQGAAHAKFWQKQLDGELPSVELLPDWKRPTSSSFEGTTLVEELPEELARLVREFAKAQSVLPSAVFLGAFQLLLHHYTGQDDVIVGMPVMGRAAQKFTADVGYFINMIPLRARCSERITVLEFLRKAQGTMLDSLYHSSYPFPLMLDKLTPRNWETNPIFQVSFAYQNYIKQADFSALLHGRALELEHVAGICQEGDADFGVEVFENEASSFSIHLQYNPGLYAAATIDGLFERYCVLLRAVAQNPDVLLQELPILAESEKQKLLIGFNDTDVVFPGDRCIHERFAAQAGITPDQPAAVHGDEQLTYRQLHAKSLDLALYLQAQGVRPDDLVGLCMERSLDIVVGLLGILQSGGAYVPLDPAYPDERLAHMLRDSQASVVLTQERLRAKVASLVSAETRIVALDAQWADIVAKTDRVPLQQTVQPHHLAYVIYTSGSTGQPKGVMVPHGAVVNHAMYFADRLRLTTPDRVLQFASLSFDTAAEEIFPTWLSGACLVLRADGPPPAPSDFIDLVGADGITILDLPTAYWHELADHVAESGARSLPPSIRAVVIGGEVASAERFDKWRRVAGDSLLLNTYGPTEATIIATTYEPVAADVASLTLPIGRPIANVQTYVLDARLQPAPAGIGGELYIGGAGIARGYWNRPELTAEKFITDPFRVEDSARLYRTGDRARYRADGTLEFLGRVDDQVKIRGFRIEPGEIEAALRQHSAVRDAVVLVREERPGDRRLVAYVVSDGGGTLPAGELRAALKASLPEFMIPAAFVPLDAIPRLPNGKLDRRALARMEVTIESGHAYLAPRNETEQRLVAIWAQVLSLAPERIGIDDGFFELGGHSLLATRVISKIRRELEIELPLKTLFEQPSVAQLAEFIATARRSDIPPIQPADRSQYARLPLSFAQERLWFIDQLEPGGAGYNVPGAVVLHGAVDLDQLDDAFNRIIARHENLRTVFPSEDGTAQQRVLDRVDFRLERIDLSDHETKDAEAERLCRADAATPFDLATGPLVRGKAIRLATDEHILMVNMHHIVSDGWSIGIFVNEFAAIVDALRHGRTPELAPLPVQYVDYSIWQRDWLEHGGVLERQLAYWKAKLAGVPESLDLATDHPRPPLQSFAGARQAFAFGSQLTGLLKRIAEREGATLYMVLLAAFKVLLHRYSGQNDICVGSPIANRQYGETEGLIGMFVNTLALRSQVDGNDTFAALLSKVKATCLEAYEHQDAPFEKVVDAVRPQRNLAISPLFQVMFILQNADMGVLDPSMELYPLGSAISKFDLTVEVTETAEGLDGAIEYATVLYEPQTIARMVEHFTGLCTAIGSAPAAKIGDLDYVGAEEKRRLLIDYNATDAVFAKGCLHQLFTEQTALHADDLALISGDERLTYQQLHDRSRGLALYLQAQGVVPDQLVGLCMDRTPDMLVALLGILQAGGAYVPLDPAYPDERLSYMIRDSHSAIVLTQEHLREKLRAVVPPDTLLIAVDAQRDEIAARVVELKAAGVAVEERVEPHHLAYVIYTSGSTGQPKGVAIEHHSPVTLVRWASDVYSREELAGVLAATSICFDLSIYEIFVTLANGGTIVLVPNALGLLSLPKNAAVTLINTVPSAMEELVRAGAIPDTVQTINLAGEPLSPRLVDKIYESSAVRKVYDLYGPSEDTTYSTFVLRERHAPVTIGRPIANTQVYILDEHGHSQPIGIPGELHIAGDGLARGYLHRPELTEEKFVPNPFTPGTRMYKTGDRARWVANGTLQYLGRIDTQVKVRGFRIELGEIEAQLDQHPQIQESVVIAQGEHKQLIAFYRATDSTVAVSNEDLRVHLLRTLPEYMVPAAFVSLAAIPLHPNGKVDRRALARMDVAMESSQAYVAPRNDIETELVTIWAEVLKVAPETIGVNDNFFELGGHSLLATQLISKIRGQLGIDVPLRAVFERPSVGRFAELIATAARTGIPPIVPVDRAEIRRLPLSFAQERLWFIDQLEPGSAAYNVAGAVVLRGPLDVDQLDHALNLIIARHESLRTVFPTHEGEGEQRVLESIDFKLVRVDGTTRDEAARICQVDATAPFDLARGPLIRGTVIRVAEDEHILLLNLHHIISDGWSHGILMKELGAAMDALRSGRVPELAPLPIQYVDYSVWQRNWLETGGVLERQLAYWKEKLDGVPESLDLATDHPRPSVQSFAGATHSFGLDAQLTEQLKRLAEREGGTLYMVLLTAFKVLLHRYTGQNDICVGSPIANRQYGETENLIGMFVNTLALRTHVDADNAFTTLLAKVKATCLEAYEHQDAPFEKVVDVVRPQRNMAISPLFQVMFILQNTAMSPLDPGVEIYPLHNPISKFDLTVELTETAEGLEGSIEYATALYEPETIARMGEHFKALCSAIGATPTARIGDLDYVGAEEKHRLLVDYNATDAIFAKGCLHQLFTERAALHAGDLALISGYEQLTYQQLHDRSRDLAFYLQAQGVVPDQLVGLCMDRTPDMLVALLGILQAGGAYVPLDPAYPDERLAYMIRDSHAAIVLTQEHLREKLSAVVPPDTLLIAVDAQRDEIAAHVAELKAAKLALEERVEPHHLAYVIYTSGSTGQPKGVAIEHHSPVMLVRWASEVYSREELAGVLAATSICFDLSIYEIFVTLANGGTIVLVPNALGLLSLPRNTAVTLINTVPSAMEELVRAGVIPDTVQTINLAGEPLSPRLVDKIYDSSAVRKVYDLYGPSEDTTYSTFVLRERHATATIGRPIANTQVYILDEHGHIQPIGIPGELHIAGDGLARGYLHRPELTEEKFVPNPFTLGTRMYKTGDRARWLANGTLQYLGRIDTQVKVRGFRIELGEIETQLDQHPQIQESVVIAQGDEHKQLTAFYRAADSTVAVSNEDLRAHLLRTLPEYMVPAAFVRLAAIPLHPNGKVDRRALARMDVAMESSQAYVAPRSDIETQLVAIWAEVLKTVPETIGVQASFFELGGHSLSAVQLMAKTNRHFSRTLPLATLFAAPTVAALAKWIVDDEAPSFAILVPIQTNGIGTPVFAVPGAGGNVLSLQPLSRTLGAEQPFYGLQAVGLDGTMPPLTSVEETARVNIAALKTVQPAGPYQLMGHSYGGVVAYEMARILLERGEVVSSLTLLDSIAPSAMLEPNEQDEATDLARAHALADLYDVDGAQVSAFEGVYRANMFCYRTYTPSMLTRDLDVSLYVATRQNGDGALAPPDYGWNSLLKSPITIGSVDADHFSILEEVRF